MRYYKNKERNRIYGGQMRMIYQFLKSEKFFVLFYFLCFLLFPCINFLYGINNYDQVIYTNVIMTFLFCVFLFSKFIIFSKKKKKLDEFNYKIQLELNSYPKATNEIEQSYQKIIQKIYRIMQTQKTESEKRKDESERYYMIWSHQVKTPIAAMKLILQEEENEQTKELLSQLFEIEEYVEMNLNFFRLNSSESDYILKSYALDSMIRCCIRKYAMFFIQKKIKINYEAIDKSIITDEKWFIFVMGQIMSNALKYTKKGEISIYIDKKFNQELLIIEDTGIGIKEEDLPRIFDKGYTGFNGRMDKKATGLGLYLCKKILNNLGLGIYLESKIGQGTKVFLMLNQYSMQQDM